MTGGAIGRKRLGGWLALPEPLAVEAAGRAGYDWVGLDLQHGGWDLGQAFRGIQVLDLLGVEIIIRVGDEDLPLIPRLLDHGTSGIILAMASNPEVVAAAIDRARYQREGRRSYGGQRYGMRPEAADVSEIQPQIYAMIETGDGVAKIRDIARVPGLAGLHVGPTDLGLGLGIGKARSGPVFMDAMRKIVDAGHDAGIPVTLHAVVPDDVARWSEFGFDELVLWSDIEILRSGFGSQLATGRQALGQEAAPALVGTYGQRS